MAPEYNYLDTADLRLQKKNYANIALENLVVYQGVWVR